MFDISIGLLESCGQVRSCHSGDVKVHKIKLKVVFYKKRVSERKNWNVEKYEAEKADKINGNISKHTCSMNRHKLSKFNLKSDSWKYTNTSCFRVHFRKCIWRKLFCKSSEKSFLKIVETPQRRNSFSVKFQTFPLYLFLKKYYHRV